MDLNIMFYCKFCKNNSKTLKGHIHHLQVHRHLTKYLFCGLGHCKSAFRLESSLRCHVIRIHKIFATKAVHQRQQLRAGCGAKYKCSVKTCGQEFLVSRLFTSHLRQHLTTSSTIPCLVDGCLKNFSSISSLTGHVSKKHRQNANEQPITSVSSCTPFPEVPFEEYFAPEEEVTKEERKEESLIALAQFYQKLEYKHMVPASVNQLISKEVQSLLISMERCFLSCLSSILVEEGLASDNISSILSSVSQNSELLEVCHSLRSIYMRKSFYEKHFSFVTPLQIPLGNGSFFYYVPIKKTIIAAFDNKSWTFYVHAPTFRNDDILSDFFDGEVYKNNVFFQENPTAIPIILDQDGFELVCPIGPASNLKHKVIGVYMAFGNLPSNIRFKKDFIQLVALCKACDFNPTEVYGRIVDDIIELQESGVQVPNFGTVKAGIAFIAGDNLGSHGLAGLVESFSRVKYFCRFCLISRPKFISEGGEMRRWKRRTVESYNKDVERVRVVNGKVINSRGVKYDSPFNRLRGFHVCDPGLPSCLGHDLCSGIVAYDLKLFIKHFVSKGWFDLETLNKLIEEFPYSVEDRKDKPCIIKNLEKKRLAGGAWQLFTFLRLFPLIVHGYVNDPSDEVWKLMLLLRNIALVSVAPEVHKSHLPGFQYMADEYLMLRRELFPHVPLRPKHHFISHYASEILSFGPLIKSWTLRFESKHSFFSRSWKSSNNNINILQTLSFKHEYFQSWVRSGGSASCTIESDERLAYSHVLYSEAIRSAVEKCTHLFSQFEETNSLIVKGTCYKKGHIVILKQLPFESDLLVGIIHILLLGPNDTVYFVVKHSKASLVHQYGSYKMNVLNTFECVRQLDLPSYYPLQSYIRDTESFICLRHAIVNSACGPL